MVFSFFVAQAPMYHHLATSLEGLTSIRAYRKTNDAAKEFYKCQDHQSEGWFLILSTTRWFALRVDAISSVFIIVCAFALIVLKDYTSKFFSCEFCHCIKQLLDSSESNVRFIVQGKFPCRMKRS